MVDSFLELLTAKQIWLFLFYKNIVLLCCIQGKRKQA